MRKSNAFAIALAVQVSTVGMASAGELRLAMADPAQTSMTGAGSVVHSANAVIPSLAANPVKRAHRHIARLGNAAAQVAPNRVVADAAPAKGCNSLACHDFILMGVGF